MEERASLTNHASDSITTRIEANLTEKSGFLVTVCVLVNVNCVV